MVIYSGPSKIDGKPIVAILTGVDTKSKNSKTGDMPQVWILRSDLNPLDAMRLGEDTSICGNCPHRPKLKGEDALKRNSRTCYVLPMPINATYKKYANGGHEYLAPYKAAKLLKGKHVRLGAYGDPAAVPLSVWRTLCRYCKSTGYTHQWRTCEPEYAEFLQASCDTLIDVVESTAKGYRTFFVQNVQDESDVVRQYQGIKFAHCPASKEKGKVTTCSACMACSGTRSGLKSNITIMIH